MLYSLRREARSCKINKGHWHEGLLGQMPEEPYKDASEISLWSLCIFVKTCFVFSERAKGAQPASFWFRGPLRSASKLREICGTGLQLVERRCCPFSHVWKFASPKACFTVPLVHPELCFQDERPWDVQGIAGEVHLSKSSLPGHLSPETSCPFPRHVLFSHDVKGCRNGVFMAWGWRMTHYSFKAHLGEPFLEILIFFVAKTVA